MKNIPIAIKGLLNILFFGIYSLIWIILWNFLYGLVLNSLWKAVPWSSDPVHMKLAVLVIILIALITVLLRKYFYFSCKTDTSKNIPKDKTVINKKEEKKIKKVEIEKKDEAQDDEMKIYIDKEIK